MFARVRCWLSLVVVLIVVGGSASAQSLRAAKEPTAVLLSDIHFEPFHDPGKVARLGAAPVGQWGTIFEAPASPTQEKDFVALQTACGQKASDTSDELWRSSLEAMKARGAGVSFVTVSGDFLAHNFDCKFKKSFPAGTEADYVSFVEKTIGYVMGGLQAAFPETPIYPAMGNNDSGCDDYRDDRGSAFLKGAAGILAGALPKTERPGVIKEFSAEGYYTARMPAIIPRSRVVVLDDLFLSAKYKNCGGKDDLTAGRAEIKWLRAKLTDARRRGDRVWVLAHIAPGVDLYSTARKLGNVCEAAKPVMFLGNEDLAKVLTEFSDVVKLSVFGHSHTDELRLLTPESGKKGGGGVAVKIVPSISPVNGNLPSFLVAQIDAGTAALRDYTLYASSNLTGVDATWEKGYVFSEAYRQPGFTPTTLKKLTDGFEVDKTAANPESAAYLRNLYTGDRSMLLKPLWPEYVCALTNDSAAAYAACVCKK